jgi:4-diphosphocytidyl-2-C-methyl-D-erythritol kinase
VTSGDAGPVRTVTARVPAKINLQLSVGPPRPDGYHDLVNVFHAVSLYDEVLAADAEDISVVVEDGSGGPPPPGVPTDGTNLAVRAAQALARHVGGDRGVRLTLRKRIPVAGGMAGGSADAAGALVACDALWETALPRAELDALAATLGADVPFALLGGTAMGLGRGDQLSPVLAKGQFHWVLAIAEGGLSTPAVYAECDRLRGQAPPPALNEPLMAALRSGDARALGRALRNDLQPAALSLRPALRETLEAGEEHGVLGAIVSGSGPTCAFLVASMEAGLDLAVGLTAMGLCRDVKRAVGPVPGARLVPADR